MTVNIIATIGQNLELGYNNQLLCHLKSDLQNFKNLTENNFVCMGRKTFDSIGKPLSHRHNIILTKNKKYKAPIGTYVYHSIEEVINLYHNHNNDENELFFIGGAEIYKQALPYADKLYLTLIQHKFPEADTFFSAFELSEWDHKIVGYQKQDEDNDYSCYFVEYTKKI